MTRGLSWYICGNCGVSLHVWSKPNSGGEYFKHCVGGNSKQAPCKTARAIPRIPCERCKKALNPNDDSKYAFIGKKAYCEDCCCHDCGDPLPELSKQLLCETCETKREKELEE